MKRVEKQLLNKMGQQATDASRKRSHFNLHPHLDDAVQRLCVALCPGSYIRPHRHSEPGKWELFIVLDGSAVVLLFDEQGKVCERIDLCSSGPVYAIEIPENSWHTLAALEPDTALIEIKPGPYSPLSENDFAWWAPAEDAPKASEMVIKFQQAQVDDLLSGS